MAECTSAEDCDCVLCSLKRMDPDQPVTAAMMLRILDMSGVQQLREGVSWEDPLAYIIPSLNGLGQAAILKSSLSNKPEPKIRDLMDMTLKDLMGHGVGKETIRNIVETLRKAGYYSGCGVEIMWGSAQQIPPLYNVKLKDMPPPKEG